MDTPSKAYNYSISNFSQILSADNSDRDTDTEDKANNDHDSLDYDVNEVIITPFKQRALREHALREKLLLSMTPGLARRLSLNNNDNLGVLKNDPIELRNFLNDLSMSLSTQGKNLQEQLDELGSDDDEPNADESHLIQEKEQELHDSATVDKESKHEVDGDSERIEHSKLSASEIKQNQNDKVSIDDSGVSGSKTVISNNVNTKQKLDTLPKSNNVDPTDAQVKNESREKRPLSELVFSQLHGLSREVKIKKIRPIDLGDMFKDNPDDSNKGKANENVLQDKTENNSISLNTVSNNINLTDNNNKTANTSRKPVSEDQNLSSVFVNMDSSRHDPSLLETQSENNDLDIGSANNSIIEPIDGSIRSRNLNTPVQYPIADMNNHSNRSFSITEPISAPKTPEIISSEYRYRSMTPQKTPERMATVENVSIRTSSPFQTQEKVVSGDNTTDRDAIIRYLSGFVPVEEDIDNQRLYEICCNYLSVNHLLLLEHAWFHNVH